MSDLPRAAEWLVRLLVRGERREFVLGDLEEEFRERVARQGRFRARAWCWLEVARSAWPLTTWATDGWRMAMRGLTMDVRGALRVFRREPVFAAVVVTTLAVGIGGATAVYSVIRGVVLSPLPFDDAERVAVLWGQTSEYPRAPLTVGDYNELEAVGAFEAVAASWGNTMLLLGDERAEQVSVGWVTPDYFDAVGVQPALGRTPTMTDGPGVVLSHGLWARRYGSDPGVIGRVIDLGGEPFEVFGVLPAGRSPDLTSFAGARTSYDLWRLMPPDWVQGDDRSIGWLRAAVRLRGGVTLERAQAEVDALMTRVNATVTQRDGGTDLRVNVIPARVDVVGDLSRTLWILLAAVCGVLLVAAANVAHLLLARGEARGGEVAVRVALGGSRLRLIRQFLVESGVFAVAGGAAGLAVAWLAVRALLAVAPPSLPRLETVRVESGVFVFALFATAGTALLFGLLPALRVTRVRITAAMERRSTQDAGARRWSRALVVVQVALSLMLVTGTGLLLRSVAGLHAVDLGFQREGVLTFGLDVPDWGATDAEAAAKLAVFGERIGAVPGVQTVGFTNRIPLGGGLFTGHVVAASGKGPDETTIEVAVRHITPGYLEAIGARLVSGRALEAADGMGVALVDAGVAARAWPGESAVGRRLRLTAPGEDSTWVEIVGVVAPMKHDGVAQPAAPTLFVSMVPRAARQNFRWAAVRVTGNPLAVVEPVRDALAAVDANAVVARARTMGSLFDSAVASTRFATFLLLVFGATALLLATVGLHGVMAFTIRRRTRELGIRMALGAERGRVLREAFLAGVTLVVIGLAFGLALSLAAGRLLDSLLFEVAPRDIVTLTGSALVILVTGLLGAWLPARLVLGVDPARALRSD